MTMENAPIETDEVLSGSVYRRLKDQLMRAEFAPLHRFKVRDLARTMGTSETPVREALVQLAREGAVEIKPRYYIRVRRVGYREYLETRDMRIALEALAAEKALPHISDEDISDLEVVHHRLVAAEASGDWRVALQANFDFHFGIYRRSQMVHLVEVLEGLWVRIGPLLSSLYPDAQPTYVGPHQHENVLIALRNRDAYALRMAICLDLMEGGARLVNHLKSMEKT